VPKKSHFFVAVTRKRKERGGKGGEGGGGRGDLLERGYSLCPVFYVSNAGSATVEVFAIGASRGKGKGKERGERGEGGGGDHRRATGIPLHPEYG